MILLISNEQYCLKITNILFYCFYLNFEYWKYLETHKMFSFDFKICHFWFLNKYVYLNITRKIFNRLKFYEFWIFPSLDFIFFFDSKICHFWFPNKHPKLKITQKMFQKLNSDEFWKYPTPYCTFFFWFENMPLLISKKTRLS